VIRGGNVLENEGTQVFLDSLLRFKSDNKSITHSERAKALFESYGTKLECLWK